MNGAKDGAEKTGHRNKSSESSPRSKYPAGGGETSEDGRIHRIPSVSTLHPREPSDVLTNSAAPRADNYFCAVGSPRVFIYPGPSLFPFPSSLFSLYPSPSLSFFHLASWTFRANDFSWHESNPTPAFAPFFARPWGGRGEGYGAWCSFSVLNHLRDVRTVREPPPTGPSTPPFAGIPRPFRDTERSLRGIRRFWNFNSAEVLANTLLGRAN